MKVVHRVLRDLRLTCVWLSPTANFRDMATVYADAVRAEPEIVDYDYICDLTAFAGDAFCQDINDIAQRHGADRLPGHPTHTCFVTRDPAFGFWASAMDEMFGGRRHLVFSTVPAAWSWLRANRQAPMPPLGLNPPDNRQPYLN